MINKFRGKNYFLSNFFPVEFVFDGRTWPSSEHAFQAMKSESRGEQEMIRRAASAGESKNMGRNVLCRPDWEEVKVSVMRDVLIAKFSVPDMKAKLLATGDEALEESNGHGDVYWGTVNGYGKNILGKLLMEVRSILR